jgi:glucose-1-phosphate cytidylyltransferase
MGRVLEQHRRTDAMVTVTAVRPPSRFGAIEFEGPGDSAVHSFSEKPETSVGWINGGFMAVEPEFIDRYIEGEFELESTALRELAACGGLHAYRHEGFWMCMDTRRDRESIEEHVRSLGRLPWIGG